MLSLKNASNFVFNVAFSLLTTHELEAMRRHEWRVLPLTRWMSEQVGMNTFILMHVPLFAGLASGCWAAEPSRRHLARRLFSSFCVVHVGLHWLFRNDQNYEFEGFLSNGLILGAGVAGALLLTVSRWFSASATFTPDNKTVSNG